MTDDMLRRRRMAEETINSFELDDSPVTLWMGQNIQKWVERQIGIDKVLRSAEAHYSQDSETGAEGRTDPGSRNHGASVS